MAEENVVKEEKKSSKTVLIIILILLLLLLIGVVLFFALRKDNGDISAADAEETTAGYGMIQYADVAVPINEDDYAERIKKLYEEAEEGQITVKYQPSALSTDGTHFICEIGNSSANHYDMYFNIYLDETFEDQILLTGLFPPGTGIEEFESEIPLDPGEYKAVLVFTQVNDDHATLHAQSMVYITLKVGELE